MNDDNLDNIPLLDELIEKGTFTEDMTTMDLEERIKRILQRHTTQAVEEIMGIIESNKN